MVYYIQKGGVTMYIDYSKLWKLLIDKGMSKTDLMELTGISSRVLAKLSKNQTVTTDTIARICTALDCDVSDIMECVSESQLSVYAAYQKLGVCAHANDVCYTVRFTNNGQKYVVYVSAQSANKKTHIRCYEGGSVHWNQFYPIGHIAGTPVDHVLVKPHPESDEIAIVVIKGNPGVIMGLDENGFVSSKGRRKNASDVYVMSEAAFKVFVPRLD